MGRLFENRAVKQLSNGIYPHSFDARSGLDRFVVGLQRPTLGNHRPSDVDLVYPLCGLPLPTVARRTVANKSTYRPSGLKTTPQPEKGAQGL